MQAGNFGFNTEFGKVSINVAVWVLLITVFVSLVLAFFTGGALGSALAAATLVAGGWHLTCVTGVAFAGAALALYAGELVRSRG